MNKTSKPFAVFVTGAHMDVVGRLNSIPVNGASNPGKIENVPGGIALNMASAAVQLGVQCSIIGPIGDDLAGKAVRNAICERGIIDDMVVGGKTGTYTSILAPDGTLVIALADLEIYEEITAASIFDNHSDALSNADFLVLNTNVSAQVLSTIVQANAKARNSKIVAATISPAKAPRLRQILSAIDVLFTNKQEAQSLLEEAEDISCKELGRALNAIGVKSGTISNGADELFWWEGKRFGTLSPSRPEKIASVTGAGDALGGTVLAGLAKQLDFEAAVQCGMLAAKLTLQDKMPVCLDLNWHKLGQKNLTG